MSTTIERMARAYFEATFDGHLVSNGYLEEEWQRCRERFCQQMAKADAALWQPIDTAPRDGSVFLAWGQGNSAVCEARWLDLGEFGRGWDIISEASSCADSLTHWRPLPEPPA